MTTTVEPATEIRPFHVDIPEEELAELRRRIAAGTIRVAWQSEVTAIATGRVMLTGGADVACESLFVMIGSIPAEGLLRDVGLL